VLASGTDILCFQETQHATIKPADFQTVVTSGKGHGQLIAVRKGIKFREFDVTRWYSDNLHVIAVELSQQPVRNIDNVYACNRSMKEQDWMILNDMQTTLPGATMLCGDSDARGKLWGNTNTNPQGETLEDLSDRCYLTCINDGKITRRASRQGDSDSIIDVAITHCLLLTDAPFRY